MMLRKSHINFNRHRARQYLQIFPILSIACLFLLGSIILNPSINRAYAEGEENGNNYGISTYSTTAGISITSGAEANEQVIVAPGAIGYREHTIAINASDVSAYTLQISGPTNLTGPAGATTIAGADNKTPANMTSNTWGYGWGDTTNTKESLYYQTLSTTGTNLTVPAPTNNQVNATKKLVFAVKFASNNAYMGQYKASVTLSMVATPSATSTASLMNDTPEDAGQDVEAIR